MIRATVPEETPALLEMARATLVFKPAEIVALREVLDDYHAFARANGHRAITFHPQDKPLGFAYYAPAAMTDRTWYLYWIVVEPALQGSGIGSAMLEHVEAIIKNESGRLLLIETSSLPHYDPTRRFYLKHQYEPASVLRDYYADGDDMVVFRKRFSPESAE